MKQGGWKRKGGGLRRKAPSSAPTGISRTRDGSLRVRDLGYMRDLHDQGVQPVDIAPGYPNCGKVDLHHAPAPEKYSPRRSCDASVVALSHDVHMALEAGELEERAFLHIFAAWSAFHYWAYRYGHGYDAEGARAYQKWVLEKMEEEFDEH